MSSIKPHGLHHVTAIATDPQRNVDFYTTVLGLRLVKQTVNFDRPDTYHLYYGDEAGRPSTLLTFFPWPEVPAGQQGTGLATATAFSVPPEALGWWQQRLAAHGVETEAPVERSAEEVLTFRDPDGLVIELVAADGDTRSGWDGVSGIAAEQAVRGLHAITMSEQQLEPTADLLTGLLGLHLATEEGDRTRFTMTTAPAGTAHGDAPGAVTGDYAGTAASSSPGTAAGDSPRTVAGSSRGAGAGSVPGTVVDVSAGRGDRGRQAGGTVHHFALRAPDGETQARWRQELVDAGLNVTEIIDRHYFTSIYFREPGGVLLEIATDAPGFTIDEPLLELGRSLKLPPWLEPTREQLEHALPPLTV